MSEKAFDSFALKYDEALQKGISVSGEDKDFFAKGRVCKLAQSLKQLGVNPHRILDFGCGTGSAISHLLRLAESVKGVDISNRSLDVARSIHGKDKRIDFALTDEFADENSYDLAFCNGVFHHITAKERQHALNIVFRSLKPGGLFAFWENNPWNPGTRIVMSRIPFDRDAETIAPPQGRFLLKSAGFHILSQEFHFYFPRSLSCLRFIEPSLKKMPFGAQYQIIAKKTDK
jgi:SAM-dependent methyltransferase